MADRTNLISADLEASQVEEMIAAIRELTAGLAVLISLDSKQRRRLVYPGDAALGACEDIAQLAEQNPELFPTAVVDAAELRRDLDLARVLTPLKVQVSALNQALSDTIATARSDAYRRGLKGYTLARLVEDQVPGIKAMIGRLRQAFARRASSATTATPAASATSVTTAPPVTTSPIAPTAPTAPTATSEPPSEPSAT